MLAKYFSIIQNYVLSVFSQRKYTFYNQNTLLDAFRRNPRNFISRNASMVIPLSANQDLTPTRNASMVIPLSANQDLTPTRNASMVIPLSANQDLTPMLYKLVSNAKMCTFQKAFKILMATFFLLNSLPLLIC